MGKRKMDTDNYPEIDAYFNDLKKYNMLTREEEYELARKYNKEGDQEALNKLIEGNLRFVISIAKKYRYSGVPFPDLIAEGNLGLLKAAKKYDYTKGIKFITYAVWWIKNSIDECIKRVITDKEIAISDLNITKKWDDDNASYIADYIEAANITNNEYEDDISGYNSKKMAVEELMGCLEEREIKILSLYYGLYGKDEMTLNEIGKEYNMSSERIRQIISKSIDKMKCAALMNNYD